MYYTGKSNKQKAVADMWQHNLSAHSWFCTWCLYTTAPSSLWAGQSNAKWRPTYRKPGIGTDIVQGADGGIKYDANCWQPATSSDRHFVYGNCVSYRFILNSMLQLAVLPWGQLMGADCIVLYTSHDRMLMGFTWCKPASLATNLYCKRRLSHCLSVSKSWQVIDMCCPHAITDDDLYPGDWCTIL